MNVSPVRLPRQAPSIDFGVIDQPAEALVLPGVDLFASLAAGDAVNGTVTVELGGKQLDYTWKETQCAGHVGEEAIELKPNECHTAFEGHVGANSMTLTQEGLPGLLMVSGKVADVDFLEQMALDPACPLTGHFANISGNVGQQMYQADVYRTGNGYRLCGTLGDKPVHQSLILGPHGGTIEGNIAGVPLHQVVTVD